MHMNQAAVSTSRYCRNSSGVIVPDRLVSKEGAQHQDEVLVSLDRALEPDIDELHLAYMPIVDLRSGLCVGAEALLRWQTADGRTISPDDFIALAERHQRIRRVTEKVLEIFATDVQTLFKFQRDFYVALNVSSDDLLGSTLVEDISALTRLAGITAENIVIEVTERKSLDHDMIRQQVASLRDRGIKVALDDFGTGYASLACLAQMPVDYLKIDRTFVQAAARGGRGRERLLEHIVQIARSFNLSVVAEGIETRDQFDCVHALGVEHAQGWYLGKPMTPEALGALLSAPSGSTAR